MQAILLSPPIAFLISLILVGGLSALGRALAGPSVANALKSSTYASGETPPTRPAAPGYRPFFVLALFFAILHLGTLVLGSGGISPMTGVYLGGLFLALLALVLG